MGRICRIIPEEAVKLAFQEAYPVGAKLAAEAGLPMDNPQYQQILQNIAAQMLYAAYVGLRQKYGIFTGIGDDSAHFAHFGGTQLVYQTQGVKSGAPVALPPAQRVQMPVPVAPPYVPPAPQAAPPPYAPPPPAPLPPVWPNTAVAPNHAPAPASHVVPNVSGQPLQPLRTPPPPPPMPPGVPGQGQHTTQRGPHAVPVNAPILDGNGPASLTEAPAGPMPSILD